MQIRLTSEDDVPALQAIVEAHDMFPSDLLPEMIEGFLSGESEEELWLSCERDGAVIGFCYAVAEQLAEGTWNMLTLAVDPSMQRSGLGRAIVTELETMLAEDDQRILIVDTSSTEPFAGTRAFYQAIGYVQEARIREFWGEGDDKIVFWKSLRS